MGLELTTLSMIGNTTGQPQAPRHPRPVRACAHLDALGWASVALTHLSHTSTPPFPPTPNSKETTADDIHGMRSAAGILTENGGMTSHAAVRPSSNPQCIDCLATGITHTDTIPPRPTPGGGPRHGQVLRDGLPFPPRGLRESHLHDAGGAGRQAGGRHLAGRDDGGGEKGVRERECGGDEWNDAVDSLLPLSIPLI